MGPLPLFFQMEEINHSSEVGIFLSSQNQSEPTTKLATDETDIDYLPSSQTTNNDNDESDSEISSNDEKDPLADPMFYWKKFIKKHYNIYWKLEKMMEAECRIKNVAIIYDLMCDFKECCNKEFLYWYQENKKMCEEDSKDWSNYFQ